MSVSSSQLLLQIREGNRAARDAFVLQTLQRALLIAKSRLKTFADAEDVVQEAYISAFKNLHQLDDVKKFEGWFFTIVIHQALDLRRKRRVENLEEWGNLESKSYARTNPIEFDEKASLYEALLNLRDELALPFSLYAEAQLTFAQIAETMNLSITQVKILIIHARCELQLALGYCKRAGYTSLSKTERLVMYYSEGNILTDEEIGFEIGIASRSVKQRRCDAKHKLAQFSGEQNG